MTYSRFYYFVSAVVGVLQIIDGVVLISSSNVGAISLIFSLFEMLWVVFSVVAIFKVKVMKYVPASYVAYNVAGWVYGAYIFGAFLATKSSNPEMISVPMWVAIFGICFGIYFSTSSILAIKLDNKNA